MVWISLLKGLSCMRCRKSREKFSIPNLTPIMVAREATLCLRIFLMTYFNYTTVVSRLIFKKVLKVSVRIGS
jgi:hypothetical protein